MPSSSMRDAELGDAVRRGACSAAAIGAGVGPVLGSGWPGDVVAGLQLAPGAREVVRGDVDPRDQTGRAARASGIMQQPDARAALSSQASRARRRSRASRRTRAAARRAPRRARARAARAAVCVPACMRRRRARARRARAAGAARSPRPARCAVGAERDAHEARVDGEQRRRAAGRRAAGLGCGSRGAASAHSRVPAANLALWSAMSQRLGGRALDAAEAEAQRAARVVGEAGERDGGGRGSDDEHGGGGADGRAGGDVRATAGVAARAGASLTARSAAIEARPVSARLRCSPPWATSPRASASECGMRTSRSQRCAARCRSARTLARGRRSSAVAASSSRAASGRGAGRRWRAAACARASAARGGGQRPDDVAWLRRARRRRRPSRCRSRRSRGRGRRAPRAAGRGDAPARSPRRGRGGEATRRSRGSSSTNVSRGRLPVGDLLGELARGRAALACPASTARPALLRVQLGEQHRRCALARGLAREAERERRGAGAADESADRDERAAGFVEREPAGDRCVRCAWRSGVGCGRLGLRLPLADRPAVARARDGGEVDVVARAVWSACPSVSGCSHATQTARRVALPRFDVDRDDVPAGAEAVAAQRLVLSAELAASAASWRASGPVARRGEPSLLASDRAPAPVRPLARRTR